MSIFVVGEPPPSLPPEGMQDTGHRLKPDRADGPELKVRFWSGGCGRPC